RSTVCVVALEGGAVIPALVAKEFAKPRVAWLAIDQEVPIVVTDFMAEMAEQGAVGLSHIHFAALALCVIGFGKGNGDDPILVPGHDRLVGGVYEKAEGQPMRWVFDPRLERQFKPQKRVEEPFFRAFDRLPMD